MTEPLPETDAGAISTGAQDRIEELAKGMTVLAIGPGISRDPQTAELVRALVAKLQLPMVVDADGLNAFEGRTAKLNGEGRTLVITPHPGEMARLAGCTIPDVQRDRLGTARKFAREHELIVVLKGHRTLVVRAGRRSLGEYDGQSGHGYRRHGRHFDRHGCGDDRAAFEGCFRRRAGGGASAWTCRRRDA